MQLWYHEICLSKIFDEKEDIMEKTIIINVYRNYHSDQVNSIENMKF